MNKLFNGVFDGLGAIASFPATIQKMMWAVCAIGGLAILMIVGSISWSIGTGGKAATVGIRTVGAIAESAIP